MGVWGLDGGLEGPECGRGGLMGWVRGVFVAYHCMAASRDKTRRKSVA